MRRYVRAGRPARVTVVTVTHIPFLAGYYAQSLDVLRLMLASLRAATDKVFDLYVFDNASCPEARDFLLSQLQDGSIQSLTLSVQNVGIMWGSLFGAAPGEIIVYADGDIFFHPGWLASSLKVLETFPNVGIVTAMPTRHAASSFAASTLAWAREAEDVQLTTGALLERQWIADYCEEFGLPEDEYLRRWNGRLDYRLNYGGAGAFVGAVSNQFAGRKSVLESAAPPQPSDWVMHQSGALFERLDALGYLMLSTDTPYIHHLGNTLSEKWRDIAQQLGAELSSRSLPADHSLISRIFQTGLGRRAGLKIYDKLFRWLYRGHGPKTEGQ
jgi:hypothetical protein